MKKTLQLCAVAMAMAACGIAQAEPAGSLLVKVGAMTIHPKVSSGNLTSPSLPDTKVDVGFDSAVAGGVTYMFTDNWAIDIPLAAPFKFNLAGAGAIAGVGKIGEVKVTPATVFAQYRLQTPNPLFHPYVGVGLTYAYFFDETGTGTLTAITNPGGPGTSIDVDSKFAPTLQLGASIYAAGNFFVDVMMSKTFLKTTATLSTGQSVKITLDPLAGGAFVGYRF